MTTSAGHVPNELPINDAATWWSVPADQISKALASKPLVVLLHGLGADEIDLTGLVAALPHGAVYASVRAPLPIAGMPGYAWFPPLLADGELADSRHADAAARGLLSWLDRTQARARTTGPVALVGFSQGGAMSVQLLRHAPERFVGAAVLAGFVAPGSVDGDTALAQMSLPVLWCYDPADPVVGPPATDRLREFLATHTHTTERTYAVGHGINTAMAIDVKDFLESLFA